MMELTPSLGIHLLSLLWAWLLARTVRQKGWNIDVEKVMGMALCHDMGEALTGDIGTAIKPGQNGT